MSNLDQILLRSSNAAYEDARQFRCRMDELKDQEQRQMWDFLRECIRGRNKRTRNAIEKENDNAIKRCS